LNLAQADRIDSLPAIELLGCCEQAFPCRHGPVILSINALALQFNSYACTVLCVTELVDSGVDWGVIESWLAAKGVAYVRVTKMEQIGGGTTGSILRVDGGTK
jgi:hypothetical protein